jgi:hypothetical protein
MPPQAHSRTLSGRADRAARKRRRRLGPSDVKSRVARLPSDGSANMVLNQVTELVQQNQALARENSQLKSVLTDIARAAERMAARPQRSARGELAERMPLTASRRARGPRLEVRRVTDPVILQRRRAAIAKAREALAAKRAAQKARRTSASSLA